MQTQILKYKKIQKVITESGPSLPGLAHIRSRADPIPAAPAASPPGSKPRALRVGAIAAPMHS